MQIWHPDLLPILPTRLLSCLHRDVCACRGKAWGRNRPSVRFLWLHGYTTLHRYHMRVMSEMRKRGWKPDETWANPFWRGMYREKVDPDWMTYGPDAYPEHNAMEYRRQATLLVTLFYTRSNLWYDWERSKFTHWLSTRLQG